MLREYEVARVERLLDERCWSLHEIARRTGFSRGTVRSIARGEHRVQRARRNAAEQPVIRPRCPTCGAVCTAPCVACGARAFSGKRRRRPEASAEPPLTVDLRGPEFVRYQQVRRAREAAEGVARPIFAAGQTTRRKPDGRSDQAPRRDPPVRLKLFASTSRPHEADDEAA